MSWPSPESVSDWVQAYASEPLQLTDLQERLVRQLYANRASPWMTLINDDPAGWTRRSDNTILSADDVIPSVVVTGQVGRLVSSDELRRAGPGFEARMPGMDL